MSKYSCANCSYSVEGSSEVVVMNAMAHDEVVCSMWQLNDENVSLKDRRLAGNLFWFLAGLLVMHLTWSLFDRV